MFPLADQKSGRLLQRLFNQHAQGFLHQLRLGRMGAASRNRSEAALIPFSLLHVQEAQVRGQIKALDDLLLFARLFVFRARRFVLLQAQGLDGVRFGDDLQTADGQLLLRQIVQLRLVETGQAVRVVAAGVLQLAQKQMGVHRDTRANSGFARHRLKVAFRLYQSQTCVVDVFFDRWIFLQEVLEFRFARQKIGQAFWKELQLGLKLLETVIS